MPPKERAVVAGLGAFLLVAVAVLVLVGNVDAEQLALAALIVLCFVGGGYVLIRSRHQEPPSVLIQEVEQDETVWPPAPKKEEPGTGSTGSAADYRLKG